MNRCSWATNELSIAYHDREWGVPVHDDNVLFEFLVLEGAQAGLSWDTILRKRENYRAAFSNFDPRAVARFSKPRIERIMQDPGVVRNRLKVEGAVKNAKAFLAVQREYGSFDRYLWDFVDGKPLRRPRGDASQTSSPLSDALSKDLRKRGFTFVGTTICYSFLQAVGVIDDHVPPCFKSQK